MSWPAREYTITGFCSNLGVLINFEKCQGGRNHSNEKACVNLWVGGLLQRGLKNLLYMNIQLVHVRESLCAILVCGKRI